MNQTSPHAWLHRPMIELIRRSGVWAAGLLLAGALRAAPPAVTMAQTVPPATRKAAPDGAPVHFKVRNVESAGQLIRVPVNKSVVVDFSRPVKQVRLAKPEFAEVSAISPKQILVTGKSFGTTQMIVWFDNDQRKVFDLAVDIELERLVASIRAAVPRARVRAYALLDAVVLTGSVPNTAAAERVMQIAEVFSNKVINHIKVAGVQQVLLRVTVAEVNRTATRQLGFNGWLAGDNVRDGFVVNNLDGINPANIGAPEGVSVTGRVPFVVGQGGIPVTSATTLSFGFPRVQMQVFVKALRENGLLRVLAEPNLVAINGQSASFLAGGEIPIPIVTDQRIRVQFKEFGVRLNFTPVVISEDRIRLKVTPEISEPDFSNAVTISGFTIPAFTSRRVDTVVELGSGQTFAIGGLLNDRIRAFSRQVPGLGDLPVLGALFRSVEYQNDRTELVVLVTPELIAPLSPDQVAYVPGARHIPPNDIELYMLGQIEGRPAPELEPRVPMEPQAADPSAALRLRGPVGPAGYNEGS